MDTAHDHEVDRLMNLPLELRQRVYLFCGFPVAKDWYHACRDEVVSCFRACVIMDVTTNNSWNA